MMLTMISRFLFTLLVDAAFLSLSHASGVSLFDRTAIAEDSPHLQAESLAARQAPASTCGPRPGCITTTGVSDCCGPTGRPGILADTCFTTVNVTGAPATYNVNCFADGTPNKLDASAPNSYYTATVICDAINSGKVPPNTWYWAMPQAGFALGVWLPGRPGDAPCPYWDQCVIHIYYHMIQGCGSSAGHNGGSVNVAKLPDRSQTGLAVDAGYPSYIMVPRPLTGAVANIGS